MKDRIKISIMVLLLGIIAIGCLVGWGLESDKLAVAEKEAELYRQQLNAAYSVFESTVSNKDEVQEVKVILAKNPEDNVAYITTITPAKTEFGMSSKSIFTIYSNGDVKQERYDWDEGYYGKVSERKTYQGDCYTRK